MSDLLSKLRTIKRLNTWTNSKLLEVYRDIDIQNVPNYKIIEVSLNYLRHRKCNKLSVFSKDFYIVRGWTEEDAINRVSDIQRKNGQQFIDSRKKNPENYPQMISPMSTEFWIKKFGYSKDGANIKIKEQRPINVEYWMARGYSKEDATVKISEYQSEQSNKFKKKRNNNPEKYNDISPTQLKYWLKKGYSTTDAKLKLKDHQTTFSLDKCIKRYGEVDGKKRWKHRQETWKSKVFNTDSYIGRGTSIVSCKFFNIIKNKLGDNIDILEGINEKFIKHNTRAYKYDFTITNLKKIIEFNGDYWHCNPIKYKDDYYHKVKKMTAKEIWEYDSNKKKLAEHHGYTVLTIWENDYYKYPEKEIQKCLNFIYND